MAKVTKTTPQDNIPVQESKNKGLTNKINLLSINRLKKKLTIS